jgi:hypothetical protein
MWLDLIRAALWLREVNSLLFPDTQLLEGNLLGTWERWKRRNAGEVWVNKMKTYKAPSLSSA